MLDVLLLTLDTRMGVTKQAARSQDRPARVDKRLRALDPHQVLLLPRRWTIGCLRITSPGSSPNWWTAGSGPVLADCTDKRDCPPYDPRLILRLR